MNKESGQKLEKRFKFTSKYDHSMETVNLNGMETNSIIEYRVCLEENSCRSLSKLIFLIKIQTQVLNITCIFFNNHPYHLKLISELYFSRFKI